MLKKLAQMWNYFKKGRGELGVVLTVYNMMLTYSIKFNVNFSLREYIVITLVFGVICMLLGVFFAEKVEPQNNVISPYAQDGLSSAIYLQESFIAFYKGDIENAVMFAEKAKALREKWLRNR